MNENELKDLWKSTNEKLDHIRLTGNAITADLTRLKIESGLSAMKPNKIFALLLGFVWVIFVDTILLHHWESASPFFIVSAIIQVLSTKIAMGIYVYHLILIHNTDMSEPVINSQKKLAGLRASTLWAARILFLQLPVWTIFYWNDAMFKDANTILWGLQAIVTLLFTGVAIWLFINIRYENCNKKWFRFVFGKKEWQPIIKAMDQLNHLEKYDPGEEVNKE